MALRIVSSGGTRGPGEGDDYMSRLIKLVPTEAVTAYPLLLPKAQAVGSKWALFVLAWVLLGLVIVIRWYATSTPGRGPQWGTIIISAVSFLIWVYATNGDFGFLDIAQSQLEALTRNAPANFAAMKEFLVSLSFVVWTVVAPLFYKGDR